MESLKHTHERSLCNNAEWTVSSSRTWVDRVHVHMAMDTVAMLETRTGWGPGPQPQRRQPRKAWHLGPCFNSRFIFKITTCWSVCFSKMDWGESTATRKDLFLMLVKLTIKQKHYRFWNPKTHQVQKDPETWQTTTQTALKTISALLPEPYGTNSGNHISPGEQNCITFCVSIILWIYWMAERQSQFWKSADQTVYTWVNEYLRMEDIHTVVVLGEPRWEGKVLSTYLQLYIWSDINLF